MGSRYGGALTPTAHLAHNGPMRQTPPTRHLRASDLRGVTMLATAATLGVSRISEGVHQQVLRTLGAQPGPTRGITGLVYRCIEGVARVAGRGLTAVLKTLEPLLAMANAAPTGSYEREAVLAALNGVLGDQLQAQANPLATPMTLRDAGHAVDCAINPLHLPHAQVTGKILLLVHGLCMNDLQWQTILAGGDGQVHTHDHGAALAQALGYTPVYLRYNTGLHTSQNGEELARLLDATVEHWPGQVQEVSILAHSMGGLVVRSAVQTARGADMRWLDHLKSLVFLGTPHHGAPLERAGSWVDILLGSSRWSKPFAKLAQLRSAGITDLRHGHVQARDWEGHERFNERSDTRLHLPLPDGVACFAIAATTAAKRSRLSDRLIGDGLVPVRSALGQHADPRHCLAFAKDKQWVAYRMNHMQLLSSPLVSMRLIEWLGSVDYPSL